MAALTLGSATTVSAAQDFLATGQTSCSDQAGSVIPCAGTGQDGDLQMGKTLSYQDLGDGTIKDNNTEFVWEKKSDDGGIHDRDNVFTWQQALDYAAKLNNICELNETKVCSVDADCGAGDGFCGFAGKRDWRLPNIRELGSIPNYEMLFPGPTVSPVFNTNCVMGATVLTGSCTAPTDVFRPMTYWSSTSGDVLLDAWFADFTTGDIGAHLKAFALDIVGKNKKKVLFAGHVRAVRGGLFPGP